jgi:hypothetical protein
VLLPDTSLDSPVLQRQPPIENFHGLLNVELLFLVLKETHQADGASPVDQELVLLEVVGNGGVELPALGFNIGLLADKRHHRIDQQSF